MRLCYIVVLPTHRNFDYYSLNRGKKDVKVL